MAVGMDGKVGGAVVGVSAGINNEPRTTAELKKAEIKAHVDMCMAELEKVYGKEIPKVYTDFFERVMAE